MRDVVGKLLAALALAAIAGLCGAAVLGALLTGAIDGPARGADAISLAAHPIGFWLLVAFYLVLCICAALAAYSVATRRPAA